MNRTFVLKPLAQVEPVVGTDKTGKVPSCCAVFACNVILSNLCFFLQNCTGTRGLCFDAALSKVVLIIIIIIHRAVLKNYPLPVNIKRHVLGVIMPDMFNIMFKVRDETNLASSSLVDTGNANDLLGVIVSYSIKVFFIVSYS